MVWFYFVFQDLVAWVTTGFLHIPHAEDIPNTVTVGNGGGVILRPHNYFDEDPSVNSPDAVYITPKAEQSCETNRVACFDQGTCSPTVPPFTYNGFEGSLKFEEWSSVESWYSRFHPEVEKNTKLQLITHTGCREKILLYYLLLIQNTLFST